MTITPPAAEVWRLYETDGFPASGPHRPIKTEVKAWGESVEAAVGDAVADAAAAVAAVASAPFPRSHLAGLTLSTAGSSSTFAIAVGSAADSTNVSVMALASSYSKTTSAWAVGSGNGALDTGSIANNTWYHVHLIKRVDTGVVDVLFSLSASAPTMPANYTLRRRIGSIRTNGSAQWVRFFQLGDEFLWDAVSPDASAAVPGSSGSLIALFVPTGVQVNALASALWFFSSAGNYLAITSPDVTSAAAGAANATFYSNGGTTPSAGQINVRTNTSGQVRVRSEGAGGALYINTYGWIDRRGRDT